MSNKQTNKPAACCVTKKGLNIIFIISGDMKPSETGNSFPKHDNHN